jgi:hypothetical protein
MLLWNGDDDAAQWSLWCLAIHSPGDRFPEPCNRRGFG